MYGPQRERERERERESKWSGHVVRMEEINAYRILVGKSEGKRSLASRRRERILLKRITKE